MRPLSLLAILLLAGCATPAQLAAPPGATASVSPPAGPELAFTQCADITAHVPMPMDQARALAPEPLTPLPFYNNAAGLEGWRWVVAARCKTMAGPGLAAQDSPFVLTAVVVAAPPAWQDENVSIYMAVIAVAATDAGLADWFTAAGHGMANPAAVSFDVTQAGPARLGRVEWGGTRLVVPGATPAGTQGADHVRLFLVKDGKVTGAVDWRVTASQVQRGPATLSDGAAGLGGHFWGDTYAYNMTRVALAPN